ncbi:MAG: nitroreductase family protein, partial [Bacteroidales bacterium]|nr:nitroreductase family protein [Bacteroidales bacterium]
MNEVIKALKERRSVRKFKADMPKKEDLNQIIEAGLWAASGRGQQSPIIIAVTNKELRDRLSAAN